MMAPRNDRGVYPEHFCEACRGNGVRTYSNTATWRGGIAGQACTQDVCDKCWGSGDRHNPWTDIRKLEQKRTDWQEDQVFDYIHRKLGMNFDTFKYAVEQLAKYCDKQERRRKLPEGRPERMDEFWYRHTWHAMSNMLQRLVSHERRSNSP